LTIAEDSPSIARAMNRPDRAVALLRVVVGAWFVKAVWTKVSIADGAVPYPTVSPRFVAFHPKRVAEFAAGNPIGWYKDFLETVVLPHAALFATLQTIGEVAVGVGLVLGLMTRLTAAVGLFLALNFGLASQWMSFGQQGFHLLLVTSMLIFLVTGAGRTWGLDAWLSRARRMRWLAALALVVVTSSEASAELRVFVTNERSDDVTVIQADTGTVLKTIAVGKRPRGVAASPDGKRVYVANSNSDSLSVLDAASLTVISSFPVGRDPEGLTFNREGTLLYVVNENESAVTIVDVATSRIVKTLPAGTEPETAVASPDGRWVAVSNETSNDVHLIDTATQAVVKKIAVPKNPRGVRFTPDSRRLFVASEQAHQVSVINMDTLSVEKSVATGGSRPVDVTFSRDGKRAWVSHGDSGDVRLLDAATLDVLATIPVGPRAWWTALTPDGSRLYVTVGRASEVAVIDTAAARVVARVPAGKLPWGVAIADVP
jgi:PQQ-dependent catabolism-associated beta-propeller protein